MKIQTHLIMMTTTQQIKQIQNILFEKVIESGLCPELDMEKLVEQCGLCDIDIEKMKTKKNNTISPELRCMARTWGGGLGIQCSYKKRDGEEFCGQHLKNGWIKHGRIDEEPPELFKKSCPKNKKKTKTGPKKNMTAFMFFRKEKTKEYQLKNPAIKKQCDIAKIMGNDWKNKMSDEDKLPFKKMEADDKKRYEEELKVFNKNNDKISAFDSTNEEDNKNTNADKNVTDESSGPGIESSTIEEEKEVAVVPYKYKGNEYLLDIDTGKVYNTTYDFVGKKVGNTIDFDAVDSSDDES